MESKSLIEKVEELIKAKDAVKSCLENMNTLVNFHGLSYWADVVERLRKEIIAEL